MGLVAIGLFGDSDSLIDIVISVLTVVTLSTAVIFGTARWLLKAMDHRMREVIDTATREIQPGANGGVSLHDLHRKIDDISGEQRVILEEMRNDVRTLQSELAIHRYRLATLDELLGGHRRRSR